MNYKKLIQIYILLLASFIPFNSTEAAAPQQSRSAILQTRHPRLRNMIAQLRQLPEANRIIQQALEGGAITVELNQRGMPFEAMWESASRRIVLDGNAMGNQGRMLCNLLFELHNANSEPLYQQLYRKARQGMLDCDTYVEAVERIEHENMVNTAFLVEKGIQQGMFPASARWEIIHDFATHYKIQQLTGHSFFIVQEFNRLQGNQPSRAYQGTVRNLRRMSRRERECLAGDLYTRHRRSRGNPARVLPTN